jgi:D-alanine-D-alanine ligase-like ATP-grasp enzyme
VAAGRAGFYQPAPRAATSRGAAVSGSPLRRLLVLHEPEAACRTRLEAGGAPPGVAAEVAFYLAQATDFAAMLDEARAALDRVGVGLVWAALDDADLWLHHLLGPDREGTLLWCLTDGFAWYRGSHASAVAALLGVPQLGSPPEAQHLCQDKFRCGALAASLGLAVPPTALVEDGEPLSPLAALPAAGPYFVKPATLGAKLGIEPDSRAASLPDALALTRRIWSRYRDRALVQAYVPGRDLRVSFMDLGDGRRPLGVQAVRTGGGAGFPTLADSRRMTSLAAPGEAGGLSVEVEDLAGSPEAAAVADAAWRLARVVPLRDYWSLDFRLAGDGTPWFLELEVCPAVTIYDFRTYLRRAHGCDLPEAVARAARAAYALRTAALR